jgi:hypothetical protein
LESLTKEVIGSSAIEGEKLDAGVMRSGIGGGGQLLGAELVINAVAMDPLTASVLTIHEIREMVAGMLAAEAAWLPQFAGKKLRSVLTISIPKDVQRAEVPVDPSLAIANRFMKLAGA